MVFCNSGLTSNAQHHIFNEHWNSDVTAGT